ncbi:MAG: ABC transporter substrate-binding protein [Devosia sp.]|jgi:ABC-type glycerol-3-phosphate transport system substrate-binding protein|nr:extracellular solute-binding protein [Devosiaceae bacterium]
MHLIKRLAMAAGLLAAMAGPSLAQTVDFYHDKANWEDAFNAALAKSPVPVKVTPYADTSSYQAAVRASLKTPSAPGLFTWWSGYRMKDLVDAGLVADVSDIWKKYTDAGLYAPSLADGYTFNGKIYAIPDNIAYWVVFYNKKVFDQYKLSPPKTWDDLEKINATLKQNNVTPFGATIDGRWPAFIWFEEFLIRQDPDLYNKLMNGDAKYTDPGVKQMFAKWKEWIDKGYFTDPSTSFGTSGGNTMAAQFAQGKLAMILVGTWYISTLTGAGMDANDIGAFIMPNEKPDMKPALIVESGPILLAQNSSQKADAMKVADYWMSAEAQQAWVDAQDFPPINKDVKAKSALITDISKTVLDGKYQAINRFWEATPTDIAEAAVDEIGNFMVHPDTADQVEQNLQTLADKVWATQKK